MRRVACWVRGTNLSVFSAPKTAWREPDLLAEINLDRARIQRLTCSPGRANRLFDLPGFVLQVARFWRAPTQINDLKKTIRSRSEGWCMTCTTQGPLRGYSKVNLQQTCQFLTTISRKTAPRTRKRLQEQGRDAPMKGLLWFP